MSSSLRSQATSVMTADQFEQLITLPAQAERHLELIDGRVMEKPMPTEVHGVIVANLVYHVQVYLRGLSSGGGRVMVEVRSRPPHDDLNVRQPDVSYYSDALRPVAERGAVPQLPDLAVEVRSPDDPYSKLVAKAGYYLENGSTLVWLIFPEKRAVEVYTRTQHIDLTADDVLDGGAVLPGFSMTVADLFRGI